ncbi:MAG TPA: hypothetical protein VEY89_06155 [Candidatus Dormibacteraeota bacterium]|nr:hypothetical protein [Candidatus Dormibacteraeota bacterium]
MRPLLVESVGWAATLTFVASYFFARPTALRNAQVLGALLWGVYGWLIHSVPVIVANILVMAAAAWTAHRTARAEVRPGPP